MALLVATMGIDDGFDVVVQNTAQVPWERFLSQVTAEFDDDVLEKCSGDFESLRDIDIAEATEGLNFCESAPCYWWAGFRDCSTQALEQKVSSLREGLELTGSMDSALKRRLVSLVTELRVRQGLPGRLQYLVDEKAGDTVADDHGKVCEWQPPVAIRFKVGETPHLPKYARHFVRFSSKVSGRCRDAEPVIAKVCRMIPFEVAKSGDFYCEVMWERGEEWPPVKSLNSDTSGADFYALQRELLCVRTAAPAQTGGIS
uniref:Uncharacterized protein n=1 Tax=Noctiluca scintillans TaxID=2966 RepID=A0A7S1B2N1_NOCSC